MVSRLVSVKRKMRVDVATAQQPLVTFATLVTPHVWPGSIRTYRARTSGCGVLRSCNLRRSCIRHSRSVAPAALLLWGSHHICSGRGDRCRVAHQHGHTCTFTTCRRRFFQTLRAVVLPALTDPCNRRPCAPAHERTHRFGLLFSVSSVRFGGHVSGKGPVKPAANRGIAPTRQKQSAV